MISTYVWNLGQTNLMAGIDEPLPSKYTAQLYDCGVLGKIQLLQETSKEGEMAVLRETYVLTLGN